MSFLSLICDTYEHIRDKRHISKLYVDRFGRRLNWNYPTRFSEKMQIFKISKQAEKLWPYVDKYEVRSYVEQTIGKEYLNTLYGVYDSVKDIDFNTLPNQFVLKTTHGSGWNIVCPDKKKLDWNDAKKKLDFWMHQNYYESYGWERQYKRIVPRIICEKYIETKDKLLTEFKFVCFNGEPHVINIIKDRFGEVRKAYYDLHWKKLPIIPEETKGDFVLDRPKDLDHMLGLVRKLAAPFPQVRVDLYNIRGKIFFGELTFSSAGGLQHFDPDEYDVTYGKWWTV